MSKAGTNEHLKCGYKTPVDFINDREFPYTAETIEEVFEEITGRKITPDELLQCRPDSPKAVEAERRYLEGRANG